jgi:hypothetical protein
VWHVSASFQHAGVYIIAPDDLEDISVALLRDVGGPIEWWLDTGEGNPAVTHYRVPTTPDEQHLIPPGLVTMDAGPEGVMRPRTTS